jgi:hypothetical protein
MELTNLFVNSDTNITAAIRVVIELLETTVELQPTIWMGNFYKSLELACLKSKETDFFDILSVNRKNFPSL